MTAIATASAPRIAHAAPVEADKADAPESTSTPLAVRLGTMAIVGGTITGLSALVGVKSVVKAQAGKGALVGGLIGAVASAAIIAATGLATRSGGAFGSGSAGQVGGFSGPPFSG